LPRRKRSKILIVFITLCLILLALGSTGLFTPEFDKEINYQRKKGHVIDKDYTWTEYQTLGGIFYRVSKEQLRIEINLIDKYLEEFWGSKDYSCRIFIDRDAKVIWISGMGPDPMERYLYWWKP